MIVIFYKEIDFKLITPIVSHQENFELIKEVTIEEIKDAVFDLAQIKLMGRMA